MQIKAILQKVVAFSIVLALASCSTDSESWKKFHRLNDGTTPKSSKLHSKYFEMNDNTDSNFTYSSSHPSIR